MISLLDMADRQWACWYLVYFETPLPRFWKPFLKKGFYHVQLWRPERFGDRPKDVMWLVVDPGLDCANAHAVFDPVPVWEKEPGCTVQRVECAIGSKKVREWFHVGPVTCVEIAKAFLSIREPFVRTPWQLYKHIRARGYKVVR